MHQGWGLAILYQPTNPTFTTVCYFCWQGALASHAHSYNLSKGFIFIIKSYKIVTYHRKIIVHTSYHRVI